MQGCPWGWLAGPQTCCCCCFAAQKMTLQETLTSPLPQLSWACLVFPLLAPENVRRFACLSWQDKVWGPEEALEERGSAARASMSQLPPAGPSETAANDQCPICLGDIENAAYVAFCLHSFCFTCIRQWARGRDACPLCRQPFERVLHTVRADDDYKECTVILSSCRRRNAARIRSRSPQRRYSLRRRPTDYDPSAGRRGPVGRDREQRDDIAPGPSNATSQQAPAAGASRERTPPSTGERLAGPAAAPYVRYGTVVLRPLRIDLFRLQ